MTKTRKRLLAVLISANILIVVISILYSVLFVGDLTADSPSTFACKFKETLGFYCPGCGGSRSVYYLLRLDIIRSFVYCPAVPVTAVIIAALDVRALIAFVKDDLAPIKSFKALTFLMIPALLLLNFAVRNILLLYGVDYIGDISGVPLMSGDLYSILTSVSVCDTIVYKLI